MFASICRRLVRPSPRPFTASMFSRHLAPPAVRRDGCSHGSLPELAVWMDVIYVVLTAARNRFDLGFDQWTVEPVVHYEITRSLSFYAGARIYQQETGSFLMPDYAQTVAMNTYNTRAKCSKGDGMNV